MRRLARLYRIGIALGVVTLPRTAFAGWGDENWGEMIWGQSVSAVPSLEGAGVALLAAVLLVAAAWRLRRRSVVASLFTLALALPLTVRAVDLVPVPNTFSNGSVANPEEVNANFDGLELGSNILLFLSGSAETVTVPHEFSDGTVADAIAVNENFTAMKTAVETAYAANTAAVAAAEQAGCEAAGGTWDAESSTCTAASNYSCFVGGFCAQLAIDFPMDVWSYTNVYDGHTRATEAASAAGCNTLPGWDLWEFSTVAYADWWTLNDISAGSHFSFAASMCE
jgi:hypothetical protein